MWAKKTRSIIVDKKYINSLKYFCNLREHNFSNAFWPSMNSKLLHGRPFILIVPKIFKEIKSGTHTPSYIKVSIEVCCWSKF